MTNPLLQSQLDRFDEKFGPIWTLWNTVVAKFAGAEKVIDTSPELAIKGFIEDRDKERLMWVVEQLDKLEWHSEFENPEFRKASELGWARFKLDFSSLIKKEIGVTE